MNSPSQTSSAETGTQLINETIQQGESGTSNTELAREIEDRARETGVKDGVTEYIAALRDQTHTFTVDALPSGVGGQFDGSKIDIAPSTITVDQSIPVTVARMQEVSAHETYHALHNHTDAMMTYDGAPTVVIADQEFGVVEVVEGLTVTDTGNEFVSDGYRAHENDLKSAVAAADLTMDDVRAAVNGEKDLAGIDDRARKSHLALAV